MEAATIRDSTIKVDNETTNMTTDLDGMAGSIEAAKQDLQAEMDKNQEDGDGGRPPYMDAR